ncbi:hypothetical protein G6F68_019696 [Rhizopus microsporus]|nr:hypothetical protein G6F68_019696 [Rhizopus microsporus]
MEQETVVEMLDRVQKVLSPRPLTPSQLAGARAVVLPEGQHFVHAVAVHDAQEVNSALAYYSQWYQGTTRPLGVPGGDPERT